eukprot:309380-Chlamydomonas_euryale.AAC.1
MQIQARQESGCQRLRVAHSFSLEACGSGGVPPRPGSCHLWPQTGMAVACGSRCGQLPCGCARRAAATGLRPHRCARRAALTGLRPHGCACWAAATGLRPHGCARQAARW